jgi:hypothetical protein
MAHVLDDNTQELTTLHNQHPIWESLDDPQGIDSENDRYAAELVAASLHIFPPATLKTTLMSYGIPKKVAEERAELWEEAQAAVTAYGEVVSELPTIVPHPVVDAAEHSKQEAIENLLKKPTKEKTNARTKSAKEKVPSA